MLNWAIFANLFQTCPWESRNISVLSILTNKNVFFHGVHLSRQLLSTGQLKKRLDDQLTSHSYHSVLITTRVTGSIIQKQHNPLLFLRKTGIIEFTRFCFKKIIQPGRSGGPAACQFKPITGYRMQECTVHREMKNIDRELSWCRPDSLPHSLFR